MEIRTENIFIVNTFSDFLFIISISVNNLTEWFLVIWEEGATLMVLKSIVGFIKLFIVNLNITDEAVIGLVECIVSHDT